MNLFWNTTGQTSLGFIVSWTKNYVSHRSNSRTMWAFAFLCVSSMTLFSTCAYTWSNVRIVATCLPLLLNNALHLIYVDLTSALIGRFLYFFSTKLIYSTRLVVTYPHRWPPSDARVHFSCGITLSQLIAYWT